MLNFIDMVCIIAFHNILSEWGSQVVGFFKKCSFYVFSLFLPLFFMSQHTEFNVFIGWFDCWGYRVFVMLLISFLVLDSFFSPHIFFSSASNVCLLNCPVNSVICASEFVSSWNVPVTHTIYCEIRTCRIFNSLNTF